jgi:molybdopterin-guanine dinucleotide biosynthesis protein A
MDERLTAIVLAGGQSSRMGQDKALISINGVPLLRQTCQVALECAAAVKIVTFQPQKYRTVIPPECVLVQERSLSSTGDDTPHGALLGFIQGLADVTTPWVLLLACDLPYLQSNILQRWLRQLPEPDSAIALIPRIQERWEPLCGFYHQSCLESLTQFMQQGGRSFQRWLTTIAVQQISFGADAELQHQEQRMLFNCNTPQDLAALQLHSFGQNA